MYLRAAQPLTASHPLPHPIPSTPPLYPDHGALIPQGYREFAITRSGSAFQALIAFHRLTAPLTASLPSPCSKGVTEISVAQMFNALGRSHLKFWTNPKDRFS